MIVGLKTMSETGLIGAAVTETAAAKMARTAESLKEGIIIVVCGVCETTRKDGGGMELDVDGEGVEGYGITESKKAGLYTLAGQFRLA